MTAENSWDNKKRYLINGTPFSSYEDLTNMIGKLKPKRRKRQRQLQHSTYANESTSEKLLPEIIRNIAVYFTVKKLDPSKTRAIGCSSSSKQHELKECLDDSTSSWWISSIGSFQNGKGEEYVEFELDIAKIVRLSTVFISIPMLPTGPLSVRTMRLDTCSYNNNIIDCDTRNKECSWKPITPILTVENRNGWQMIEIKEPIDVQYIRLVCLSNQASSLLLNNNETDLYVDVADIASAVGFFTVKFE